MQEIIQQIDQIKDKKSFLIFIGLLIDDFKKKPDEWQNRKVDEYLEAIASWTEDMEGYYKNNKMAIPVNISWKVFANILMAAKMYE